jgi:predicted dehydrogenase
MIMKNSRREFVKASAAGAAGILAGGVVPGFTAKSYGRIIGANEKVNVAVAGIHSRGGYYYGGTGHTANYTKIKESRVVAVCDVDENLFPVETAQIVKLGGDKPKTVVDFRKLLDDKEIDAVSIATPDYWHALHTIWACQAGKDVYVEKPLSWSLEEGRKMVEAARKYNRIVQIGTNFRSNRITQKALPMLQNGIIGDIYGARATVFGHRGNIGRVPDSPVPQGVNWELFRGPAPMIPFNTNHFHYNWHWYWDTATGEFGNNGTHYIDRIRVAMKKNEHPVKISCCGGFYAYDSDQQVPNLQTATFEYADGKIIEMEVRSLYTPPEEESIIFFGTKGYALLGSNSFKTFVKEPAQNLTKGDELTSKKLGELQSKVISVKDLEPDPVREEYEKNAIEYHFVNFIDCVKSRKRENLLAEVEEGHLSTSLSHLGNIAYKTGRKLQFDGRTERFIKDEDANNYLSRTKYREPYVLPKKV